MEDFEIYALCIRIICSIIILICLVSFILLWSEKDTKSLSNMIKFQLPQTWDSVKQQPRERVLSFLCSIINTHISIFIIQVFRRNLIETAIVPDADGNSRNDRYRASKMKVNEKYVITCSMDMKNLVNGLFKKYENEITMEELEYYRHNSI